MNALYGKVVFDEWVIMSLSNDRGRILNYSGPRKEDFAQNVKKDLGELLPKLLAHEYHPGDFEFARHGSGTGYEGFMMMGEGVYLLCNNTAETMDNITRDNRWLQAQVPFQELAEKFHKNPVIYLP